MDTLYSSKRFFGTISLDVFPDRIAYKSGLFQPEQVIIIKQIASVSIPRFSPKIILETTGGQKYELIVPPQDKERLRDIILAAKSN